MQSELCKVRESKAIRSIEVSIGLLCLGTLDLPSPPINSFLALSHLWPRRIASSTLSADSQAGLPPVQALVVGIELRVLVDALLFSNLVPFRLGWSQLLIADGWLLLMRRRHCGLVGMDRGIYAVFQLALMCKLLT